MLVFLLWLRFYASKSSTQVLYSGDFAWNPISELPFFRLGFGLGSEGCFVVVAFSWFFVRAWFDWELFCRWLNHLFLCQYMAPGSPVPRLELIVWRDPIFLVVAFWRLRLLSSFYWFPLVRFPAAFLLIGLTCDLFWVCFTSSLVVSSRNIGCCGALGSLKSKKHKQGFVIQADLYAT